nr:MAG TPA: hypothetical protein [Caudoviricetes sp.]
MTTSNPWIRYADALTLTEKITDASNKEKQSAQSKSDLFYWDGIEEGARTMRIDLAYLARTTPQPPSAEMVEARTLTRVISYIDMLIENALSGPSQQVQAGKLWGLKTLRAELRKQQDKPLGG